MEEKTDGENNEYNDEHSPGVAWLGGKPLWVAGCGGAVQKKGRRGESLEDHTYHQCNEEGCGWMGGLERGSLPAAHYAGQQATGDDTHHHHHDALDPVGHVVVIR